MRVEEELRDYQMPSISERASRGLKPQEMPEHERPISEQFRVAGDEWVQIKKKRDLIKGLKDTMLARRKRDLLEDARQGGVKMAKADAEEIVKASTEWEQYMRGLIEAEAETEAAWVRCEELQMRYGEWQSQEANARKEQRMYRQSV